MSETITGNGEINQDPPKTNQDPPKTVPIAKSNNLSLEYLTFPDGDIVLRSQEGFDFRVDSAILRRASGLSFAQKMSDTVESPQKILTMEESNEVLDTFLRLLYPVDAPPQPLTAAHAPAFIRLVNKLGTRSYIVQKFVDDCFAACGPLRAWALAVRLQRLNNRLSGAKRYIVEDVKEKASQIPELEDVSARLFGRLQELRAEAHDKARQALSDIPWTCRSHMYADWRMERMRLINAHPFDGSSYSEGVLELMIRTAECQGCLGRFNNNVGIRDGIRVKVQGFLELAAAQA